MKLIDLFSGIGGFSLAASWVGIKTIQFVDNNAYCQKILTKNFPGVPIHEDIKTFKGQKGSADILSGGFPCQSFSVAGKRRGKEDDRYLWPEMFRIIKEVRPTWVLAENVAGIVSMELDNVLFDLESEGYSTQAFIIPACAVDAPHKRDRVWIVAYSGREGIYQRRPIANACKKDEKRRMVKNGISRRKGKKGEIVTNAESERRDGRPDTETERMLQWRHEIERCCPADTNWSSESGVDRVAYGIPRRVDRLKGLGNAIIPQVAYQIFKMIKEIK